MRLRRTAAIASALGVILMLGLEAGTRAGWHSCARVAFLANPLGNALAGHLTSVFERTGTPMPFGPFVFFEIVADVVFAVQCSLVAAAAQLATGWRVLRRPPPGRT